MGRDIRILFTGKVQGVGFRSTAKRLARELNLKGFVRNLSDGTVELCAHGPQESVEKLVEMLKERFKVQAKELSSSEKQSYPADPAEFDIL